MTTEIEKTFFDTFGIEPKKGCTAYDKFTEEEADAICNGKCAECPYLDDVYPQITDSILLELILVNMHNENLFGYPTNIQELKDNTLKQLIETYNKLSIYATWDGEYQQSAKDIKQHAQALFKELNNELVYDGKCHFISVSSVGENGNTKHLTIYGDILGFRPLKHYYANNIEVKN